MPDSYWALLHGVVFLAALLQTATGFGFAMISVPILLIVLNSSAAIQVGMILSLVIALLLMPSLFRHVDKRLLRLFVIGSCIGIPVGVYLYLVINLGVLKLLAGLVVMVSVLTTIGNVGGRGQSGPATFSLTSDLGVGVIAGIMNASLAIPGVLPLIRMVQMSATREVIRATILALFVFSYPVAIALQAALAGLTLSTLKVTATLIPVTLIGIVAGRILVSRIPQKTFIRIILVLLVSSTLGLFIDAGWTLLGTQS